MSNIPNFPVFIAPPVFAITNKVPSSSSSPPLNSLPFPLHPYMQYLADSLLQLTPTSALPPRPPPSTLRSLHLQTLHIFVRFSVTRVLVFVQLGILYISVWRSHRAPISARPVGETGWQAGRQTCMHVNRGTDKIRLLRENPQEQEIRLFFSTSLSLIMLI